MNSTHAYTEMTQKQEEVVEEDCGPIPWYNWNLVTHGGSAIAQLHGLLHGDLGVTQGLRVELVARRCVQC